MRLALGCGRARLARQVLIEGLVLAVLAAAVAVLMARWSAQGLVALLATSTDPVMLDFVFDWRLSAFLAAIVVASALVYSVAPMVLALRLDPPNRSRPARERRSVKDADLAGCSSPCRPPSPSCCWSVPRSCCGVLLTWSAVDPDRRC